MSGQSKLSIFLENNRTPQNSEAAYLYDDPIEIISVCDPKELQNGFERIQAATDKSFYVAGYISYEAGLWLEQTLKRLLPESRDFPLLHMGIYKERRILSSDDADDHWQDYDNPSDYSMANIELSLNRGEYEKIFDRIQGYLKAGDVYQVNFTQKASFDFAGSPKALYAALRHAQAVEYAAYIESDDFSVLSLSPELFVKKIDDKLITKPMKGTCRRGRTEQEDKKQAGALYNSEKERAENLMIVDLLRNDLSRLAQKGSVDVDKLCEVEKYRSFFTMTSTIKATLAADISPLDVMRSIFPCGSVTGAPKIRAMEIIGELENRERGIYTGAIGYFTPQGDMCFSVPIRTLTIDNDGKGELGIGGAIVADSIASQEYDECLLKAEFVTKNYANFDLIEAILWRAGEGYISLEDHLERMENSAKYFSMNFNHAQITDELERHAKYLTAEAYKVRLILSKKGNISISSEPIEIENKKPQHTFAISKERVDSRDVMLFHKTTDRGFFARQYQTYHAMTGCYDVVFLNEKGQVTQGSFTNIFIQKDGIYYTPPPLCGLLSGIARGKILKDEKLIVLEKTLYIQDLKSADHIYLCNSIRGQIEVVYP